MTVPKRRITTAERALTTTATICRRCATHWPDFIQTAARLAPAPIRGSRPAGTTRTTTITDPTGTAAIALADAALAARTIAWVDALRTQTVWLMRQLPSTVSATPGAGPERHLGNIAFMCETAAHRWPHLNIDPDDDRSHAAAGLAAEARRLESIIARTLAEEGPQAAERHTLKPQITCSGRIDPLCGEIASTHRGGICERCFWKDYRQRRTARIADTPPATSPVLETVTVQHRAPTEPPGLGRTIVAECVGTCTRCGQHIPGPNPTVVQQLLDQHHTVCEARPR